MAGFVAGLDRGQATLLPECLEDWVDESNPVRAVGVFVDAQELRDLGFDGVDPATQARSRIGAQRPTSAASNDGNTNTSSKPRRRGSIGTREPCVCAAKPSSIAEDAV